MNCSTETMYLNFQQILNWRRTSRTTITYVGNLLNKSIERHLNKTESSRVVISKVRKSLHVILHVIKNTKILSQVEFLSCLNNFFGNFNFLFDRETWWLAKFKTKVVVGKCPSDVVNFLLKAFHPKSTLKFRIKRKFGAQLVISFLKAFKLAKWRFSLLHCCLL